ncbi:DeoR/GlpR family transcriptional regulator, partial [Providencia vermicola]|nr:DeoR/GlpR family transcriptional regulator [Providencia vermicola]
RNAMVNLGNMNLIDYLFTDKQPPDSILKVIEQHNVQLELC